MGQDTCGSLSPVSKNSAAQIRRRETQAHNLSCLLREIRVTRASEVDLGSGLCAAIVALYPCFVPAPEPRELDPQATLGFRV